MATATKETKKVLIPPVPQVIKYKYVDDGVTLRLSQKEAVVLNALVRSVGGSPITSVREQTQAIVEALQSAGVPAFDSEARRLLGDQECVYSPNGSSKVLDELMSRKEPANLLTIQTIKEAYTKAAKDINNQIKADSYAVCWGLNTTPGQYSY
jgi:hypothetical protein